METSRRLIQETAETAEANRKGVRLLSCMEQRASALETTEAGRVGENTSWRMDIEQE